jgi:hypothetical protein
MVKTGGWEKHGIRNTQGEEQQEFKETVERVYLSRHEH